MRRRDIICDCCGKIIDWHDSVELHGKGIIFDWNRLIQGQKVDLCNECWISLLDSIKNDHMTKNCTYKEENK